MGAFFRELFTLVGKDLRLELRSREIFASMLLYSLLAGLVFAYGFQKLLQSPATFYPGVLWVATTFAGTLGMGRLASREEENAALLGLTLSPASRGALFFAKAITAALLMAFVAAIEVPVFALMFSVRLSAAEGFWLFLTLASGAVGFALVGSIVSALLLGARGRELLLPVALYPLILPVIILGVSATLNFLSGNAADAESARGTLQIILAFDMIFAIVGALLFEQLLVE
jgi:heme exporter protein B